MDEVEPVEVKHCTKYRNGITHETHDWEAGQYLPIGELGRRVHCPGYIAKKIMDDLTQVLNGVTYSEAEIITAINGVLTPGPMWIADIEDNVIAHLRANRSAVILDGTRSEDEERPTNGDY